MWKQKLSTKKEQGFTLLEVVVSILIMTVFVSVSLQLMAVAAILKARARESTEAISWIQQDLELLKYQANIYQYTTLSTNAALNASSITVSSPNVFTDGSGVLDSAGNQVLIGSDGTTYTITSISGTTLNISPNLQQAANQNDVVVGIEKCGTTATPAIITTGFAYGLRNKILVSNAINSSTPVTTITPKNILSTGATFNLTRTITLDPSTPYNKIQISYDVKRSTGGATKAKMYTELIPRAAYECPS